LIYMEKPADNQHEIHELIRRRWSPRAFSDRPVEPEKLRSLWEAARWAPSSFNEQPWSFLAATKEDAAGFQALLSCLVEGNLRWAQYAPVLMLSVARRYFERGGRENRHALHDVGLAVENMVIQATAEGLAVHQMAGFHVEKARELLAIPDTHEPVAMIALGYPGDPEMLPEDLRQRELAKRTRKTIDQFVFAGKWEQVSPLARRKS